MFVKEGLALKVPDLLLESLQITHIRARARREGGGGGGGGG